MVRIKHPILKNIEAQVENALSKAQESFDESMKFRKLKDYSAGINPQKVYEEDARTSREIYNEAIKELKKNLQKIASNL